MSKEHAWPQWLGAGAQVEPTWTTRRVGYRRTAPDTFTEDRTQVIDRNRAVLNVRIP